MGAEYGLGAKVAGQRTEAPRLSYKPRDPRLYRPRIGLIGCGGITVHHLTAYRAAGYEVSGFFDIDPSKAVKMRDEFFPGARVFEDADSLLRDSSIEVVDIATHPEVRYRIMEKAIDAGKHILSQKPFVTDLDAGESLAERADKRGLRIAVNQNGRWAPHFSYIRSAVKAGLLGDLSACHLSVSWNHNWIKGTPFEDIRYLILYDFGIHWFDILSVFTEGNEPLRVYASSAFSKGQGAKPPFLSQASVEFEHIQASLNFQADTVFGCEDRSLLVGSKGILRSEGPDLNEQRLFLTTEKGVCEPELEGKWFPDGFHGTMGELLCAIEEGREPANSARSALRSLALCFAALKSAETGLPVRPGEVRTLID